MNRLFLLGFVVLLGLFSSCNSRDNDEENKVEERETKKLPKWLEKSAYALGRNGVKKADYPRIGFRSYNGDETLIISFEAGGGGKIYRPNGPYYAEIEVDQSEWILIDEDRMDISHSVDGYGHISLSIEKYNQYSDIIITYISIPEAYEILGEKDKYSEYAKWIDIRNQFMDRKVNDVRTMVFTKLN